METREAIEIVRTLRKNAKKDEIKEAIDMVTELATMQVEEWDLERYYELVKPNTTREKPEHIRKPL